jgi:hypothetical protein
MAPSPNFSRVQCAAAVLSKLRMGRTEEYASRSLPATSYCPYQVAVVIGLAVPARAV